MRPIAISGNGNDKMGTVHLFVVLGVLALTGYIFFATLEPPKRKSP